MTTQTRERIRRGLALWRERRSEFKFDRGLWAVPGSDEGIVYAVDLDGPNGSPRCTCPDNQVRGFTCKHIYAAEVADAVRRQVLRAEMRAS